MIHPACSAHNAHVCLKYTASKTNVPIGKEKSSPRVCTVMIVKTKMKNDPQTKKGFPQNFKLPPKFLTLNLLMKQSISISIQTNSTKDEAYE
jgi:hypothetical protein